MQQRLGLARLKGQCRRLRWKGYDTVNEIRHPDQFVFRFNEGGRVELVTLNDIASEFYRDAKAAQARILHRAKMRNKLRVIKGGKD